MIQDRLKSPLARLVRRFTGQGQRGTGALLDYCAYYLGQVTAQAEDALLFTVAPADPRLPEFTRIPCAVPWPGTVPRVEPGAQCLVGYAGGRPDFPYIAAFLSGTCPRVDMETTLAPAYLGQSSGPPVAVPGNALGTGGTAVCTGGGIMFDLRVTAVAGQVGLLAVVTLGRSYSEAPLVQRLSDGGLTGVTEVLAGGVITVTVSAPPVGTKTLRYLVVG